MSKRSVKLETDVQADLQQIEQSLVKIKYAYVRYWITQFVDLIAVGIVTADARAAALSSELAAPQQAKPRVTKASQKSPTVRGAPASRFEGLRILRANRL